MYWGLTKKDNFLVCAERVGLRPDMQVGQHLERIKMRRGYITKEQVIALSSCMAKGNNWKRTLCSQSAEDSFFFFSLVLENLKADSTEVQTCTKSSDLQAPPFVAYLAKKSKSSSGPGIFF